MHFSGSLFFVCVSCILREPIFCLLVVAMGTYNKHSHQDQEREDCRYAIGLVFGPPP